jgi:GTP-binding protein YchF
MVRIVDIAGIVRGASTWEGLGNKFLSHIRDVDAILHVVRCFENGDVVHVDGSVDPLRDISTIETELLMADLDSVSGSYERTKKQSTHQKDLVPTVEVLGKCLDALKTGKPVRALDITDPEELKILKGFGLITAKKVLYVANVSEADPHGKGDLPSRVREHAAKEGSGMVPVSSKLESELSELSKDDQEEMLESLGMTEPALASLAREAYRLLGMTVYYTAGPKEIRAWQIPVGCPAPKAASVIHTDFEKGFIRAEIYNVQDLVKLKTEAAIRAAGKLRVEGKTYIFQEGDVAHFLFNV